MNIPVIPSEDVCWEALNVTIYFDDELEKTIEDKLRNIIVSWYTLGTVGCYGGGVLHNMTEIWVEDNELGFTVDMGSANEGSLEFLFAAIEGFANKNDLTIEKILLGDSVEF